MSLSDADLALLVQTRQRVAKLLEQLRRDRQECASSPKLDASAADASATSIDAVIAALQKTAGAAKKAMQEKGLP